MKFSYKRFSPEVIRPVFPIGISYGEQTVYYEVLVDSGADICIFDAEIGELLGIKVREGERHLVGGITGVQEPYFVHEVTLNVGGWKHKTKVGFMPRSQSDNYGIIGQIGLFDHYVVNFDYRKEEIELKGYPNKK
jgi:hypothetical protein